MTFSTVQLLLTKKSFMLLIERNVSVSKLKLEVMTMQCKTVVFIAIHLRTFERKIDWFTIFTHCYSQNNGCCLFNVKIQQHRFLRRCGAHLRVTGQSQRLLQFVIVCFVREIIKFFLDEKFSLLMQARHEEMIFYITTKCQYMITSSEFFLLTIFLF